MQYVHSLARSADGEQMLVGMEFENRCPAVIRVPRDDFDTLVEATLAGGLEPDRFSNAPPIKVDAKTSRWAY